MNAETIREYCLSKNGTNESFPFDETTLVIKVLNKMFVLINLDEELGINLKCDPQKALELRERYSFVLPGYHMNKKHWNTINQVNTVSENLVKEWIDHSYNLVVASLPKSQQLLLINETI